MPPSRKVWLSQGEHDANVSPWLAIATERGCTVKWIPLLQSAGCRLDLDAFARSLERSAGSGRVGLLAVGAASNATGTKHDVARAIAIAKVAGCRWGKTGLHVLFSCR